MVDLDGFINLVADDFFRVVNVEGNVDIVRVFMSFGFLLFLLHRCLALLLVLYIHLNLSLLNCYNFLMIKRPYWKKVNSKNERKLNNNMDL